MITRGLKVPGTTWTRTSDSSRPPNSLPVCTWSAQSNSIPGTGTHSKRITPRGKKAKRRLLQPFQFGICQNSADSCASSTIRLGLGPRRVKLHGKDARSGPKTCRVGCLMTTSLLEKVPFHRRTSDILSQCGLLPLLGEQCMSLRWRTPCHHSARQCLS